MRPGPSPRCGGRASGLDADLVPQLRRHVDRGVLVHSGTGVVAGETMAIVL